MTLINTHIERCWRDDESDVVVRYTFSPGHPGWPPCYSHGGTPPDPAEVCIVSALAADGQPVTLSEAEETRITEWLLENHEPDYPEGRD